MIEHADRPDWEALAPVWHLLEDGGLNRDLVRAVAPLIRPPVLCVGGGGGLVPNLVRTHLPGEPVVSLDRSFQMSSRANRRTGLSCLVGDATALPFSGRRFETVLCATGVLEFLTPTGCAVAVAEMARVCREGGALLLAAASGDGNVSWGLDQHALVRTWYAHELPDDSDVAVTFDAVAAIVGGRRSARALLLSGLPRRGRSLTTAMVTAAADRGDLGAPERVVEVNGTGVWRVRRRSAGPVRAVSGVSKR